MQTLPPLQFLKRENGSLAFLIDNSTLETLTCPRLYELKHLRMRDLVAARAGRNFGAGLHVGWRERYLRCGSAPVDESSEAAINEAMATFFRDKPQPPEDFRTLDHACKVMKAYNQRYLTEAFTILPKNDGTPAVEASFAFTLGHLKYQPLPRDPEIANAQDIEIVYTGRVDLLTKDPEGEWVGPDHKTAFMFGQGFQDAMATDAGQRGYCWAFQQMYGRPPRGYVIDAVRIRPPTKKATYAGDAPISFEDMQRIPFYIFPDDIEEWRQDTLAKIETIFWMHARDYFQKHTKMCVTKYGRCDMFEVCITARGSREAVLSSNQFEDLTWSPLNPTH